MGLHALAHPSQCKWKTVGCRFKHQTIEGILFCSYIHTSSMNKLVTQGQVCVYFAFTTTSVMCIYFSLRCVCMCQSTSDFCMWPLACASHGLVLLFVGALLHLIPISALRCSSFECFIPPADLEDLCRFWLLGDPHSLAAVLLLNTACVIHQMLSGAVKSSHDKYCFSVYETIMLASHFKQPLSSAVDCTALAKSVLWAHSVITQRQEDVSFAKSMKYNIIHYLLQVKKAKKTAGKTLV